MHYLQKYNLFLAGLRGISANSNKNYIRYNCQAFANISGNFRKIAGNFHKYQISKKNNLLSRTNNHLVRCAMGVMVVRAVKAGR